jgi:hypothetical protein
MLNVARAEAVETASPSQMVQVSGSVTGERILEGRPD